MPLHLYSLNTRSLASNDNLKLFLTHIRSKNRPDCHSIHCLQEHHLDSSARGALAANYDGTIFFSTHCAILIPASLPHTSTPATTSLDGRLLSTTISLPDTTIIQLNCTYAPVEAGPRKLFFQTLVLPPTDPKAVITILGDLNDCPDPSIDRRHQSYRPCHWQILLNSVKTPIIDTFRHLHPTDLEYSRPNIVRDRIVSQSRIDHILLTSSHSNLLLSADIHPSIELSDHRPVSISLDVGATTDVYDRLPSSNKTLRRLNASLLTEPDFLENVGDYLGTTIFPSREKFDSPIDWWDAVFPAIAAKVHQFSTSKASDTKHSRARHSATMTRIEALSDPTLSDIDDWMEANQCITSLDQKAAAGIRLRANLQELETGPEAIDALNAAAAKRLSETVIPSILLPDNTKTTHPPTAYAAIVDHFTTLFTPPPPSPHQAAHRSSLLAHLSIPPSEQDPRFMRRLSDEAIAELEEPFTEEEVLRSISRQKNGSSPGASGLPYEFFKTFKDDFAPYLTELFNACWDEERSSTHDLLSIIRLIFKRGKPGADPSNLTYQRPVALKEASRKIKSSCIVKRLNKHLPSVIPPSQAGFVPGRLSADSAVHLHLLIDYFRRNPDEEGLLLSLDQEKAYDMVDHSWIIECFAAIGCGPRFLSLMRTMNATGLAHARVIINGFLTPSIMLNRGVGQGDGLSCPTYLISFQPFIDGLILRAISSLLVKSPPNLTRLSVLTTVSFADDVMTLITDPQAQHRLSAFVLEWKSASGGSVMVDKSRQLLMNGKAGSTLCFPNVKEWTPEEIWVWVGFPFSYQTDLTPYWDARLAKLKQKLGHGTTFHFSQRSRIQYVNTRIYATFHHVMGAFAPPTHFLKVLQSAARRFIWMYGRPRVSADVLCEPRAAGGLALVDLDVLNRDGRLNFWDRLVEGKRMWTGIARHALAHHTNSTYSPLQLICLIKPASLPDPFFRSALTILIANPPLIQPTIPLRQLLALPPSYPLLLDTPDHHTKFLDKLPSFSDLYHQKPTLAIPLPTFSTFSDAATSALSPGPIHYARIALNASSFIDPALRIRFKHILHFGPPVELPPPEPPDSFSVSVLLPPPPEHFLPVKCFSDPILSPPTGFWASIWTPPTPMRAAEELWRIAHGQATTEIQRHHYDVLTPPTCTLCPNTTDTQSHRFFLCPLASDAWDLLLPSLGRILGTELPTSARKPYEIFFGFPSISATLKLDVEEDLEILHNLRALRAITLDEIQSSRYHLRIHPTYVPSSSSIVLKSTRRYAALRSRL
ncbi:hypothetical protein P7C70_g1782, partial [Phenoliferia sp. Uapishka_3]